MAEDLLIQALYGKTALLERFGKIDVSRDEIAAYMDTLTWQTIRIPCNKDSISAAIRESKSLGKFTFNWSLDRGEIIIKAIDSADLAYFKLKYGY